MRAALLLNLVLSVLVAIAEPGDKPSRGRQDFRAPSQAFSFERTLAPPLPPSLYVPRIEGETLNRYVREIPNSLNRVGWRRTEATLHPMSEPNMLALQGAVRDQMAKMRPSERYFIPMYNNPHNYGVAAPSKIYALPLVGKDYARMNVPEYQGKRGKQALAIIGVTRIPSAERQPPHLELYGLAEVTGAQSLHTRLPTPIPGAGEVHTLSDFLRLDKAAVNLPEFGRRPDVLHFV